MIAHMHVSSILVQMLYFTGGNQPVLDQRMSSEISPDEDAAIRLPPSLFQMIKDQTNLGVFFGRYDAATLFPISGENSNSNSVRQRQVCSRVLAATVGQNIPIQNLEQPVTVSLKLLTKQGMVIKFIDTYNNCKC